MTQELKHFVNVRMNREDIKYLDAIAVKQRKHRTEVLRDLVRCFRDYSAA